MRLRLGIWALLVVGLGLAYALAHGLDARSLAGLIGHDLLTMAVAASASSAGVPEGVWLVDSDSAMQIFDCTGSLCGRVGWLRHARDPAGR